MSRIPVYRALYSHFLDKLIYIYILIYVLDTRVCIYIYSHYIRIMVDFHIPMFVVHVLLRLKATIGGALRIFRRGGGRSDAVWSPLGTTFNSVGSVGRN
jgi:hypothetical protein